MKIYRNTLGATSVAIALSAAVGFSPVGSAYAAPLRAASGANSTVVKSGTLAGYAALQTEGLASASATFNVPSVTCGASVGALQFGVFAGHAYSSIEAGCTTGTPTYTYSLYSPGGPIVAPAVAGDTVVVTIFETSQVVQAEIHDLTNGQYWVAFAHQAGTDTGAEFGVVSNMPAPIPAFPSTVFSGLQMNGDNIGFYQLNQTGEALTQSALYSGRHALVTPGSLNKPGTSFNLVYKSQS